MIKFQIETTRYTVKPQHAHDVRQKSEKATKAKYRTKADPKKNYPAFRYNMTTRQYVERFEKENPHRIPITWDCPNWNNPAPMLDPTQPEVWQIEDDQD